MAKLSILEENSERFFQVVKSSSSMKEILEIFGLVSKGTGNYRTLKRVALQYGVELPNGSVSPSRAALANATRLSRGTKYTDEEVFTENSSYSRSSLKLRLRRIWDIWECSECGVGETWNGAELVLQLDHINGIGNDNRLENLRLLCPNCHSQTATFATRSLKKESTTHIRNKDKCECGNLKTKESPSCIDCALLKRRKNKLSDCEFMELVKSTKNNSAVGRLLGISETAVRKRVKKLNNLIPD